MKTSKLITLALPLVALAWSATAHAQFNNRRGNIQQNNANQGNRSNGGLLPLPDGISRLIAVDAHNSLLAETDGGNGEPRQFFGIEVRHVYAGGIARLFGGEVIPTAPFVSPYFNGNGGFNGNNGGLNNGLNNGGNFGNNGFGNNGFGNQGFGNNGFGNQGFNNNFNNTMR